MNTKIILMKIENQLQEVNDNVEFWNNDYQNNNSKESKIIYEKNLRTWVTLLELWEFITGKNYLESEHWRKISKKMMPQ